MISLARSSKVFLREGIAECSVDCAEMAIDSVAAAILLSRSSSVDDVMAAGVISFAAAPVSLDVPAAACPVAPAGACSAKNTAEKKLRICFDPVIYRSGPVA